MQWNAQLYDQKHDFVSRYGSGVVELLHPVKHEMILDLGCGTGDLTNEIALSGASVLGLDASEDMIEKARKKFPGIAFQWGDACYFKKENAFDAVFSNAVIHWIADQDTLIQQVYNNLKTGGRFVAELGAKGNVAKIIHAARKVLEQHGYSGDSNAIGWYFPSAGEYATLLEQHGFTVRLLEVYDRPTELKDKDNGIVNWLDMFGARLFEGVDMQEKESILFEIQHTLENDLLSDGRWYADYRRLRFVAVKEGLVTD